MRRIGFVLCAACLLGLASPAAANIIYTPMTGYTHGVGFYNPADPMTLNEVYVTSSSGVMASDYLTFTFAMHHTNLNYFAQSLHFAFFYDNNSLEVVNMWPVGGTTGGMPWDYNYENYPWPNPSSGIVEITSLSQWLPISSYQYQPTTLIVPFMGVQLHIKSTSASMLNSFGVIAMTLHSHIGTQYDLFPGDFMYGFGVVHEIPEPMSVVLMSGGLLALAGRVVRRRRGND